MSLPGSIDLSKVRTQADLTHAFVDAEGSNKKVVYTELVVNKKPVTLLLKGQLMTDAIQISQYGHHSIGFAFLDDKDKEDFMKLCDVFDDMSELNGDWTVSELIKNDRLYVKLKNKNNRYSFRSNIKLDPKKAENTPIYRYQNVDIEVDVKAYFSYEEKKCGVYLEVRTITFEKDEKPSSPKKLRRG